MVYDEESDTLTFSTGKVLRANGGVIGIGPRGVDITEGWDGGVDEKALTVREKRELGLHMIERWYRFMKSVDVESAVARERTKK